jgi:enterochelin esterase-like enzyme
MAGLSNGGGQTIWFGLPNTATFAWFGIFSAGTSPSGNERMLKRAPSLFADPQKANPSVKLIWIAAGKQEVKSGAQNNLVTLLEQGIRHEYHLFDGGHTWITWRVTVMARRHVSGNLILGRRHGPPKTKSLKPGAYSPGYHLRAFSK